MAQQSYLAITMAHQCQTQLVRAAMLGQTEVVRYLLHEQGAYLGAIEKQAALTWSALNGLTEAVRLLLDKDGTDINARNSYANAPILNAAYNGHTECVRFLLDRGADVNVKNHLGRTALHMAISNGHTEVLRMLLDRGADFGQGLVWAAQNNQATMVRILLDRGADVNVFETVTVFNWRILKMSAYPHFTADVITEINAFLHRQSAIVIIQRFITRFVVSNPHHPVGLRLIESRIKRDMETI